MVDPATAATSSASAPSAWVPAGAFVPPLTPGGPVDAGIVLRERPDLALASLVAIDHAALAQAINARWGCALPQGPRQSTGESIRFLGVGPRNWLALGESTTMPSALAACAGEAGAVADQSDGYGVIEISGAKARALFEKGIGIDLHPSRFGQDNVAVTTCAHIGVILWQIDTAPIFGVALFRSYTGSFRDWLEESAAEFGVRVEPAPVLTPEIGRV